MYDDAGDPVWYASVGRLSSATDYSGTLLRFAGGQPIVGPYRPPRAPANVGTIQIEFIAPDRGEMTISDTIATAKAVSAKRARRGPITATLAPVPITPPASWQGVFSVVQRTETPMSDSTLRFTGSGIVWRLSADSPDQGPAFYEPAGGTVEVQLAGGQTTPDGSCTQSGRATYALPRNAGGLFVAAASASYHGLIKINLAYDVTLTCPPPFCTRTQSAVAALELPMGGAVIDDRMRGHPKEILLVDGATITSTNFWYFVAAP